MRYGNSLAKRGATSTSGCGCAECGGLECLCRPRFFAGQLLTEEEFNRLDKYIMQKNRLHNRYLHGWGVVCGLDVVCNDCGSGVVVKEGYALSPCGDDIVVCEDTPVDICSLINACKKKEQPDCGSPGTNAGCDETQQEWVLAICYSETSSRGITPLRNGGSSSSGGCGCGGHGGSSKSSGGCGCGGGSGKTSAAKKSSGCGCGGSHGASTSSTSKSCSPPLQCEPTVVCEGYSFRVYPAPRKKGDEKSSGAMIERFQACFQELMAIFPELPGANPTQQQLHDWCCDTKDALRDYLATHPGYDCQMQRSVSQIVCPSANQAPAAFMAALMAAREQLAAILGELMFACLCRALMPPCPGPVTDDCVPLAIVTIDKSDGCRVESICNWTTLRKYATTFPNLQYWLSILPFGRTIRESLERFCCSGGGLRDLRKPGTVDIDPTTGQPGTATPSAPAAPSAPTAPGMVARPMSATANFNTATDAPGDTTGATGASSAAEAAYMKRASLKDISPADSFRPSTKTLNQNIAVSALAKEAMLSRRQSVDAQTLLFGMMGQKDEKGQDYLSSTQRENLAQFFVLDQMAKPMMRSILPMQGEPIDIGGLMSMFSAMTANTTVDTPAAERAAASAPASKSAPAATPEPAPSATATVELHAQVKELSEMVKRQQVMIDQLTRAMPGVTTTATTAAAAAAAGATRSAATPSVDTKAADPRSAAAKPADTKPTVKGDVAKGDSAKGNVKRRPGPSNS